jgi:hypothetical protein
MTRAGLSRDCPPILPQQPAGTPDRAAHVDPEDRALLQRERRVGSDEKSSEIAKLPSVADEGDRPGVVLQQPALQHSRRNVAMKLVEYGKCSAAQLVREKLCRLDGAERRAGAERIEAVAEPCESARGPKKLPAPARRQGSEIVDELGSRKGIRRLGVPDEVDAH